MIDPDEDDDFDAELPWQSDLEDERESQLNDRKYQDHIDRNHGTITKETND